LKSTKKSLSTVAKALNQQKVFGRRRGSCISFSQLGRVVATKFTTSNTFMHWYCMYIIRSLCSFVKE
jgi:hypothetical protein